MPSVEKSVKILSDAADAHRLHHAILLCGQSMQELEFVALKIASKLFGRDAQSHPDLFTLRPEGKMRQIKIGSESERSAGEWPTNTMRRLLEQIRQSSNVGGAKIAIVYEADRMNNVTANAFLKTLEEPPADTTIFMLSARPNDLLDTIRSRCITLDVDTSIERIDDEQWHKWLNDFSDWQRSLMKRGQISIDGTIMNLYGLLARFESILARLELKNEEEQFDEDEELDESVASALEEGERRALTKKMFAEIEEACVDCALGGDGVPAVRISRVIAALEESSGLVSLNLKEGAALEYFMLNSLRIWTR